MTTYTVDTRDVFTVHKGGCRHLNLTQGRSFDFEPTEDTRAAILDYLISSGFQDGADDIEDVIAFAPCVEVAR